MMTRLLFCLLVLALASACQQAATPTVEAPRVAAKVLATVYISPTPGQAEREATRLASSPTPTPVLPTPIPSATPYIGVFLGEVESSSADSPIVDPALLGAFVTPQPPVSIEDCEIQPNEVFGATWMRSADAVRRLGCPIQIMFGFKGDVQLFERGAMYRREETGEIWAIAPGGANQGKFWYVAKAPDISTEGISAPGGLRVPLEGFGGVWMGVPGVRQALGFAQTDEERTEMAMQLFDSGSLLLDSGSGAIFALIVNSDLYGPFD